MPLLAFGLLVAAALTQAQPTPKRIAANDNRVAAGRLRDGVLRLQLVARPGRWYPTTDSGPSAVVFAFAEEGKPLQVPGPMIRVPTGTIVDASIRNALGEPHTPLVLHGFQTRPGLPSDTLVVAPGAVRRVRFAVGAPGTYFYWGSTTGKGVDTRDSVDSQLSGAFVVDSASARGRANATGPFRDRVFVLGVWFLPPDTTGAKPWVERVQMVINGKSFPYTERFTFTQGDTVRWRWVNPSADSHPMHLHGFYFSVLSRGFWAADTALSAGRQVVTELMLPGSTMSAQWVAGVAGNWLFHCHFAFHVSRYLSLNKVPDDGDPGAPDAVHDGVHGMAGLVLALQVRPRGGESLIAGVTQSGSARIDARPIRLLVQSAPKRYGDAPGYGFVIDDGRAPIARDSIPLLSPPLLLRRGEPVRITVVNHLRASTAVHWHGMELTDSYVDGVPGWSGAGAHVAPSIAPGDSFIVAFTPPRAGTFIYHSHSNEGHQIGSGLYGAMIVEDPMSPRDTSRERTFVIGGNGPDYSQGRVNGALEPASTTLVVGTSYRFRIVQMNAESRVRIRLLRDSTELKWRAVAKDGADLPVDAATERDASVLMGPGETADFEFTPREPGRLVLRAAIYTNEWSVAVPLMIEMPPR